MLRPHSYLPFVACALSLLAAACGRQGEDGTAAEEVRLSVAYVADVAGADPIKLDNRPWTTVAEDRESAIVNLPLFTEGFYWIRVRLHRMATDSQLLVIAQPMLPAVTAFVRGRDGGWSSSTSGYREPMRSKPVATRDQVLRLPPGASEVYLRVPAVTVPLPLSVVQQRDYVYDATWRTFLYGLCLGLLVFVILNNLFLAISLRQLTYFHYVLLVFGYTTFIAITEGFLLYLFPRLDLMEAYFWNPILTMPFGISYGIVFLQLRRYTPRLYRVMLGLLIYIGLFIVACAFMPDSWVSPLGQLHSLIVIGALTAMGLMTGYRGNRLGYFFAGAYLIFLVLAVLEIVYINTGSPEYVFGISYVSAGILIEAITLAFLLSKRFEWERQRGEVERLRVQEQLLAKTQENERIVRNQNALLEDQIRHRTRQLNEQKESLETSLRQLQLAQAKLVESEKLASLGQLTAGVAHEINNPVNFISNGVNSLRENHRDIAEALEHYLRLDPERIDAQALRELQARHRQLALGETLEDNESLFRSIGNGVERTVGIIKSLRNFSRLDEGEFKDVDLNEGLESTLRILNSSIRQNATIVRDYGDLPLVYCQAGKINQVFLNLINNAVQAIEERGTITLTTRHLPERGGVSVAIADTGRGIPAEHLHRIFEPFFTTKAIGKGTGLGLSITYGIIEEHGGTIEVESTPGQGTCFLITLPVAGPQGTNPAIP